MSETRPAPIGGVTRLCAVYGHPIKHSASPAMQNAGLAALGLDWRYVAFDVDPKDLRAAIGGAQAMKYVGLNLTVPHKLLAVDLMAALDSSAREFGAVNTVRFEGRDAAGQWVSLAELAPDYAGEVRSQGFNTDAEAIAGALREDLGLELKGASVLLLGAGGAGRVAALKLAAEGVRELYLVNRTAEKAAVIGGEIGRRHPGVKAVAGYPPGPVDLILNATSLGLQAGDGLPFDAGRFTLSSARLAYDMIYRPAETPFLRAARAAGCRVANGIGMLLHQGAKALEIWSGRPAPVAAMRAALLENVYG